jgi:hypothetical protein
MGVSKSAAALLMVAAAVMTSGCASIVHGGPRSVPVASTPPGAKVSIYDRNDKMVMMNNTPFIASLPVKGGYFKGQSYRLVFEMPGYATSEVNLKPTVSGWYFGNILFGGLLGMLVVDPLTGAMYNLSPEKIEQPLTAAQAEVIEKGEGVMVVLLSQATESERQQMIRMN